MIDPGPHDIFNQTSTYVEYKPIAIYYGSNIEEKNKNRLHNIATSKCIKEFEMFIDYASSQYEMRYKSSFA